MFSSTCTALLETEAGVVVWYPYLWPWKHKSVILTFTTPMRRFVLYIVETIHLKIKMCIYGFCHLYEPNTIYFFFFGRCVFHITRLYICYLCSVLHIFHVKHLFNMPGAVLLTCILVPVCAWLRVTTRPLTSFFPSDNMNTSPQGHGRYAQCPMWKCRAAGHTDNHLGFSTSTTLAKQLRA